MQMTKQFQKRKFSCYEESNNSYFCMNRQKMNKVENPINSMKIDTMTENRPMTEKYNTKKLEKNS